METKMAQTKQTERVEREAKKDSSEKRVFFAQGRFELLGRLGSGSFGHIFKAYDYVDKHFCAAKVENRKSRSHGMLTYEHSVYTALADVEGFPRVVWFGSFCRRAVLVLELLGSDFEALFARSNKPFPTVVVLRVGLQLLERLRQMHVRGFVHRDLKPANLMVGRAGANDRVFLTDLGLAKRFVDAHGDRLPPALKNTLAGTPRFVSVGAHTGRTPGPRDDLESFAYVLLFFLKGKLPWQGLHVPPDERVKAIGEVKKQTPPEQLCEGLEPEFRELLLYVRGLDYYDAPNYDYLRELLEAALSRKGVSVDGPLDLVCTEEGSEPSADSVPEGEEELKFLRQALQTETKEKLYYREQCEKLKFLVNKMKLEIAALKENL